MEQLTKDEIGAAAAAHAELGREYDHAVAEGLVERIGAEIDRRVDARLASPPTRQVMVRRGGSVPLALGSMIIGGITSVSVLNSTNGFRVPNSLILLVAVIWVAIGAINISYNRSR